MYSVVPLLRIVDHLALSSIGQVISRDIEMTSSAIYFL